MQHLTNKDVKLVGEWDGEIIWREKTPAEKAIDKLVEDGMKKRDAERLVYAVGMIIKN